MRGYGEGQTPMPITAAWADAEESVIHQTFTGAWTWADFHENTRTVIQDNLVRAKPYIVHVICDFRASSGLPNGSPALSHARSVMRNAPDNLGLVIIVTPNAFIRTLVGTFGRIYRPSAHTRVVYTSTIEEAHTHIANARQSDD